MLGNSKIYSTQDIEKLKQKIVTYKDTLETLKKGNTVDDYLFMKSEFNGYKNQVSNLKGEMGLRDEKQSIQIEEYDQKVKKVSVQIDSLNQTVEELNQDIALIINKLKHDDNIKKINTSVDLQDSLKADNKNQDSDLPRIKEGPAQTKNQTTISPIQISNSPLSYKQLQNFINNAKTIQEPLNVKTPLENFGIKKNQEYQQPFNKHSFPSNGSHPAQINKGLNKSFNTKMINNIRLKEDQLTKDINKKTKKHAIPIKAKKYSTKSIVPNNIQLIENNLVKKSFKVHHEASIEKKIDTIDVPIEALIEIKDNTIDVPIEASMINEKTIEISVKKKQTGIFSFLNFFQKKQ